MPLTDRELVEQRIKKHDWYYEYADDLKSWNKGRQERNQIINDLRRLPMTDVADLFKLVPDGCKDAFFIELNDMRGL